MKDVLCIYPPFCPPTSPPYALTYLAGFLQRNAPGYRFSLLDLNARVHKEHFSEVFVSLAACLRQGDLVAYREKAKSLKLDLVDFAKAENCSLREGVVSPSLELALSLVEKQAPAIVLLSIVYNSQAFFALSFAKALKRKGIPVIVGGPAVTPQLKEEAVYLEHEVALLEFLLGKKVDMAGLDCRRLLDFSTFSGDEYATPELVVPLRTSSCCYYQRCAFCTHHQHGTYEEYSLDDLRDSIVASRARLVFFTDDMIHKKRLLELASMLKPLDVRWMCQLRPTKELDEETLRILFDSGLRLLLWGVESGADRILRLMRKTTNIADMSGVLAASKTVGIANVAYILLGFPGESKEEFLETVAFLKANASAIDLVSTTVFGLQEGSPICDDPEAFGITGVHKTKRIALPDKLSYTVASGLHADEAKLLRKRFKKTFEALDRFPKEMNLFREHMLFVLAKD